MTTREELMLREAAIWEQLGGPGSGCHGDNCGRPASGGDYKEGGAGHTFKYGVPSGKDDVGGSDKHEGAAADRHRYDQVIDHSKDVHDAIKQYVENSPKDKLPNGIDKDVRSILGAARNSMPGVKAGRNGDNPEVAKAALDRAISGTKAAIGISKGMSTSSSTWAHGRTTGEGYSQHDAFATRAMNAAFK